MEILCTRPRCPRPENHFDDLDHATTLKTAQQRYCKSCGMPLILGGRYIPLRLLGKGGFGAAFLACDRHSTKLRQCVVKQFQPATNLEAKSLEIAQGLFEREATVLEEIGTQHPQIPNLFAFFPLIVTNAQEDQEEQYFYLVQELIDGENLEEELTRKGKFSEAGIEEILRGILPVLQYIHERHIIHRDIKPSNIMRDKSNKLYLLDFGAVKQVASVGNPSGRSTSIYSMGFAPPEQMRGGQVYPSTDLYALGASCVHLLTGQPTTELFDDNTNRWNWRSHVPDVSDHLAGILDKLLRLAPQDRYQTATEVLAALDAQFIPPPDNEITLQGQEATATPSPSPSPPPMPQPSPITVPPPSPPPIVQSSRAPRFSALKILLSAAFTGFEGALLVIAGYSLLAQGGIVLGLMAIAGLIFAQWQKWIEGKDLPILAIITALLMLIPQLQAGYAIFNVLISAILTGAGLTLVATLFLLIYQLLRRLF